MNHNIIEKIHKKVHMLYLRYDVLSQIERNFSIIDRFGLISFPSIAYIDTMNFKKNRECKTCSKRFQRKSDFLRHIISSDHTCIKILTDGWTTEALRNKDNDSYSNELLHLHDDSVKIQMNSLYCGYSMNMDAGFVV